MSKGRVFLHHETRYIIGANATTSWMDPTSFCHSHLQTAARAHKRDTPTPCTAPPLVASGWLLTLSEQSLVELWERERSALLCQCSSGLAWTMEFDVRETLAGTVGAFCCVYAGLPFDVIKIRLQTQGANGLYNGVGHAVHRITYEEGLVALWKGAVPAVSSAVIENSVLFTVRGAVQRFYIAMYAGHSAQLTTLDEAFMGSIAGVFAATAITPAEVIKCKLQFQRGRLGAGDYRGPLDCMAKVWQREGIRGLYSGYSALLLREVPFNFFFFGAYELYTSMFKRVCAKQSRDELHPLCILTAGGLAGATGWSIVFPADVITSHMQTAKSNAKLKFRDTAKLIYRQNGLAGFYRGWGAAVMRSFPANGSLFLGVEMTHRVLRFFQELKY